MKAFLWSALALLALCGLVIWNSLYISSVTDEMSELATQILTLDNSEELDHLSSLWEKNKVLISLSVPHNESDEMEKNLILLHTKFENDIDIEVIETVSLVKRSIEELKIHGTASIDNIF